MLRHGSVFNLCMGKANIASIKKLTCIWKIRPNLNSLDLRQHLVMSASRAFAILLEDEDVGKHTKESKKRITWQFGFEGEEEVHTVVLVHSIMSGKRWIELDGVCIFQQTKVKDRLRELVTLKRKGLFDFAFTLPGHLLRVSVTEKYEGFIYGE